jgi:hypothetical protein
VNSRSRLVKDEIMGILQNTEKYKEKNKMLENSAIKLEIY